jgi:signal transduction histidine kinase
VDFESTPLPPLAPGLDMSVYRIVQEALTNALKHGTGKVAQLRLSATPSDLAICASNPVGAQPGSGGGSGLGLVGIEERVGLLGGRLTHGRDAAQFRLSVSLPLATAEQP